jgi:putative endopeptidase
MKINRLLLPLCLCAVTLNAVSNPPTTKPAPSKTTPSKPAASKDVLLTKNTPTPPKDLAIKPADFDPTVKPSEDFFDYVNRKWIKQNPIPGDKSRYGMFDKLDEQSRLVVKRVLESAANANAKTPSPKGSNKQILGDFYHSAMDTNAIEKAGVQPLQSWFTEIKNANTPAEYSRLLARLQLRDVNSPLGYYVDVDAKKSSRYIFYINQGGLGLPDRDFYFRTDEKSKKNREAYKEYVQKLFKLAHLDQGKSAEALMQDVLEIENALAAASMTRVELRDPEKTYHLYTIESLRSEFKNIDWDAFFGEMKIQPKEIVLGQPLFFKAFDSLLMAIPRDKWVSYQEFHMINSNAKFLSKDFVEARFDFYGRSLQGIQQLEPRWKRVSHVSEQYLRDLIGQEYVKTNFSPTAKKRAMDLVDNIKASLAERIKILTWMGDETKAKALDKLQKIDVKIGYPDKWWTYENTDISNQPYVSNVLNAAYAENLRVLSRLDRQKIDRTEWGMGPQTVNAYYNPLINEIVFPAAILQPPFFYEKGDDAVNYGGIGMVIGHEITHGFDDQGSQYDAEGNLKNWWTDEDKKKYEELTAQFVKQYGGYNPLDSLHLNGELTLGENIADLGGMIIAFNAFKKANGNNTKLINGLTPEQRFFVNYAIIWRESMRPESLRMQVLTDPHSPAKFRVNGVLSNLPEFYNAFHVKQTDSMYIDQISRARMW